MIASLSQCQKLVKKTDRVVQSRHDEYTHGQCQIEYEEVVERRKTTSLI